MIVKFLHVEQKRLSDAGMLTQETLFTLMRKAASVPFLADGMLMVKE